MSADHVVFLRAIVIDATNKAIRMKEGATTSTVTLVEGTYYLRGDGAADDLLKIVDDALTSHVGANTYVVSVAWSADPAAGAAVVTITQSGGATFQLLWADVLTTFDPAWLGFADANTADSTAAKASTLSPSAVWVADGPFRELEPVDRRQGYARRARSGRVRRGKTGETNKDRRLGLSFVCAERTHEKNIAADPDRAFNRFLDRWTAGSPAELHLATATGFVLGALSSSTEHGAGWHVGGEGDEDFDPQRHSAAAALYSWDLDLWPEV